MPKHKQKGVTAMAIILQDSGKAVRVDGPEPINVATPDPLWRKRKRKPQAEGSEEVFEKPACPQSLGWQDNSGACFRDFPGTWAYNKKTGHWRARTIGEQHKYHGY